MGTRNLIIVKSKRKVKIAQYGQWDGNPTGQGYTIAEFIQNKMSLDKLKEKVDKLKFKDRESGLDIINIPPEYRVDTGADILALVQDNSVEFVKDSIEFLNDRLYCEWAYEIDLDDETVVVYQDTDVIAAISFTNFTKERMDKLEAEADENYDNDDNDEDQ